MKVWVDCTAAAHPLVLRPLIEELEQRGHEVVVTTRDYGQTHGVLERLGIPFESFGSHAGSGTARKAAAVAGRSAALARWARRTRPDLALAHGSVDLAVVCGALRIPSAQMQDYEYAGAQRKLAWGVAKKVLVPDSIPLDRLLDAGAAEHKLHRFPGLKEDYYLADLTPDPSVLGELGLDTAGIDPARSSDERVLVVMRPPPETSAYHARNDVYEQVLDRISADERSLAVVIPRTEGQAEAVRARRDASLIVPERAIDAQSLIAYADLVVSAGGTMNREAVALGTPVYTIFSGRMGGVDEELIREGLLRSLDDPEGLDLSKREGEPGPRNPRSAAPLVDAVLEAAGAGPGAGEG